MWKRKHKRKREQRSTSYENTEASTSALQFHTKKLCLKQAAEPAYSLSCNKAIEELCKILSYNFHEGVLFQQVGLGENRAYGGKIIFNICSQLTHNDVASVLSKSYVLSKDTILYCNQFALVFQVCVCTPQASLLKEDPIDNGNDQVDYATLHKFLEKRQTDDVQAVKTIGFIPPKVCDAMNSVLEAMKFILFTHNICLQGVEYRNKRPFYLLSLTLEKGQDIQAIVLKEMHALNVVGGKTVSVCIAFNKPSNSLKFIIKVSL